MRFPISNDWARKLLLMIGLSVLITIMIAPEFTLVPARYEEGDIIPETILISDAVTLVDERSTGLRRDAALGEFPPVYDFDARLRKKTLADLQGAFAAMRERLAARRTEVAEARQHIRRNALSQVDIRAAALRAQLRYTVLSGQKRSLIRELGVLGDQEAPAEGQAEEIEKLRFDLLAVTAQVTGAEQEIEQLATKAEQSRIEGLSLIDEEARLKGEDERQVAAMQQYFEKTLSITLEETTFRALHKAQFNSDLESKTVSLLLAVSDARVVSAREGLPTGERAAIQVHTLDPEKVERFDQLSQIVGLAQVRERIDKVGQEIKLQGEAATYREAMIALAQRLTRPNLTENKGATERLKQDLSRSLSPVYFSMNKGDVVARAGDTATAQQVEIINALNAYNLQNPKYPQIVGTFLIVLLALGISYRLIEQRVSLQQKGFSRLILMALLLLVTLLVAQLVLLVVPALTTVYDAISPTTFNYLIPAALTSMLAGILLPFEIAVFLGFVVSLCLAILLDNSLTYFLYALMGSFIASIPLAHYDSRFSLWQQGLRISAMNFVVLIVLTLLKQNPWQLSLVLDAGAAVLNGLGVAFLTATLLPLIEKMFDITTNLRLLELANMNHPALKELSVRAPGTYHHSIVVGNLSESAAEGILANPLLVRVSSYYHDLGKMLCPLYFVENQGKKNYHDDLPARTSARIIINHVKDGLEIARRHKLGQAIMDIIGQHHGNSLVRYFYHRAQEEEADLGQPVDEAEFRYPGPRPQSKEAGLVMVADVTEAATRSLSDPSPDSIREMVQKLTTRIYMEGQLDESGMSFNDLNFIEKTFTKMLVSIHHHRIAYPDLPADVRQRQDSGLPNANPEAPADEPEPDATELGPGRASS